MSSEEFAVGRGWGQLKPSRWGRLRPSFPASDSTAFRVIDAIVAERLEGLRRARALARERAWAAGARPRRIVLDIDSTLVTAHSEKEGAAAPG